LALPSVRLRAVPSPDKGKDERGVAPDQFRGQRHLRARLHQLGGAIEIVSKEHNAAHIARPKNLPGREASGRGGYRQAEPGLGRARPFSRVRKNAHVTFFGTILGPPR
jgi:hypothetical protein